MSTRSDQKAPESVFKCIARLVRMARFVEQMCVQPQRRCRVRVTELRRNADRVELQTDDQKACIGVAEVVRAEFLAVESRPHQRALDASTH